MKKGSWDRDKFLPKSLHREGFHLDRYGNSKLGRLSGAVMSEKGGKQGSVEFGLLAPSPFTPNDGES